MIRKKIKNFMMLLRGGLIGMCFEYHFRLNPPHNYALIVGSLVLLMAIIKIFENE